MSEPPEESDQEIWRKIARDTAAIIEKEEEPEIIEEEPEIKESLTTDKEELPKAEDYVQGPLPEDLEDAEKRAKKLEAARISEELKKAEEARRIEALKREEEELKRKEEEELKRKEEEELKRKEEEELKRKEEEELKRKEEEEFKKEKPSYTSESDPLLLVSLINSLQAGLDIKLDSKKYQSWIKGWDKAIEIRIIGKGDIHVLIKDNQMKASLGKATKEPDIIIEGEYETVTNYLNGELDPILMFFDFVLLRKIRLVKGLDFKLSTLLSGNILQQARELYRIDKILKVK